MNQAVQITGCEAVRKHIATPIPEVLWHYTSFGAFEGILASKSIWATDYRFLNDREEFTHCKKLAFELARKEPEFSRNLLPSRDLLVNALEVAFNSGVLHESRLRVMVASFTERGDQLSQWRGYAGSSAGVSIGLDLRALRPPEHDNTYVVFAPCVYRASEKRSLLKAIFEQFYQSISRPWNKLMDRATSKRDPNVGYGKKMVAAHRPELDEIVNRACTDLQADLLRIAPLMKDESFYEEKEWRLVLPSEIIMMPTRHPIKFRTIRNALVPYIAYPLLRERQEGPILCTDLILGPGSHPSAEVGINLLFGSQMIPTRARASKVPYRPAT